MLTHTPVHGGTQEHPARLSAPRHSRSRGSVMREGSTHTPVPRIPRMGPLAQVAVDARGQVLAPSATLPASDTVLPASNAFSSPSASTSYSVLQPPSNVIHTHTSTGSESSAQIAFGSSEHGRLHFSMCTGSDTRIRPASVSATQQKSPLNEQSMSIRARFGQCIITRAWEDSGGG
ncbi:hypothetical protein BD779DRAFT_683877 [Infundibulicybe gibba]|nr:hypothetical protein BD779DRAFT_683877 [Infundibulicybe gibba]